MFKQLNVNEEAERFLRHFPIGHEVEKAVNAVKEFNTCSLDELLENIKVDEFIDKKKEEIIKERILKAEEAAKNYYKSLMRKLGESSKLVNLDDKASYMLRYSDLYNQSIIEGFDISYENRNYLKCKNLFDLAIKREIASKINKKRAESILKYEERKKKTELLDIQIREYYCSYQNLSDLKEPKK